MSNEGIHPYVHELNNKLNGQERGYIQLKLKTLLNHFGYQKRTERNVKEIKDLLASGGITTEFSLTEPVSIHERIKLIASAKPSTKSSNISSLDKENSKIDTNTITEIDSYNLIHQALNATVLVISEKGLGSGFIVHPDGLVITCRHVIEEEDFTELYVKVITHPNRLDAIEYQAKVIKSHRNLDYALLYIISDTKHPIINMGNPKLLKYAEEVYALGSPAGLPNTVSKGIVSNPTIVREKIEFIQTDARISPGYSGGPLINKMGFVMGINQGGFPEHPSANFCTPVDYLKGYIEDIAQYDKETILGGYYCPFCGHFAIEHPDWYCENCGTQKIVRRE